MLCQQLHDRACCSAARARAEGTQPNSVRTEFDADEAGASIAREVTDSSVGADIRYS